MFAVPENKIIYTFFLVSMVRPLDVFVVAKIRKPTDSKQNAELLYKVLFDLSMEAQGILG